MNRIGPNGEVYPTQPTKVQTFRSEGWAAGHEWNAIGPRRLAEVLRKLADSIDKHAAANGFRTDPPFPGQRDGKSSESITTPLCHVELSGHVIGPPFPISGTTDMDFENYRIAVTARLGFE